MNLCKRTLSTIAFLLFIIVPNMGNATEFNLELVGTWPVGACTAVECVGNLAYFSSGKFIRLVDFTNPKSPVEIGHTAVASNVKEIYVSGNYVYMACGENGLYIVDFSKTSEPKVISHVDTENALDVTLNDAGTYAFVADGIGGVRIINVANPANPVLKSNYQANGDAVSLDYQNNYLYIAEAAAYHGVKALYVADPENFTLAGQYMMNNGATAIRVSGQYAYVLSDNLTTLDITSPSFIQRKGTVAVSASNKIALSGVNVYAAELKSGMKIFDVTNVLTPSHVSTTTTNDSALDVAVYNNRAFIADNEAGLLVMDVTTKTYPYSVGTFNSSGNATGVYAYQQKLYVTDSTTGLRIFNVSNPANPLQIGQYKTDGTAHDLNMFGSYIYIADSDKGVKIIDVTDPSNPTQTGSFQTYNSLGVASDGSYVFSAAYNSGFIVFDVTNPSYPSIAGRITAISQATGIDYDMEYVLLAAGTNGLKIIDVFTRTNPVEVGTITVPGVPVNVSSRYPYAYVATEGAGLQIVDWKAPAVPLEVGSYDPGVKIYDSALSGSHAYLAADDLYIVNVGNPKSPYLVESYEIGGATSVAVEGDYIYVAAGANGVLIFKITAPAPPTNVVLTDVPDDNGGQLEITWGLSADDDELLYYGIYRSLNPIPTEPVAIESFESVADFIEAEKTTTILMATLEKGTSNYTDEFFPVSGAQYYYWVAAVAEYGESAKIAAGIRTGIENKPYEFKVSAPFPNPFNPTTSIQYELPEASHVKLVIYDCLGRKVTVLQDGVMNAGTHKIVWDARNSQGNPVGSGVYLYQLSAGNYFNQGKVMFMR